MYGYTICCSNSKLHTTIGVVVLIALPSLCHFIPTGPSLGMLPSSAKQDSSNDPSSTGITASGGLMTTIIIKGTGTVTGAVVAGGSGEGEDEGEIEESKGDAEDESDGKGALGVGVACGKVLVALLLPIWTILDDTMTHLHVLYKPCTVTTAVAWSQPTLFLITHSTHTTSLSGGNTKTREEELTFVCRSNTLP